MKQFQTSILTHSIHPQVFLCWPCGTMLWSSDFVQAPRLSQRRAARIPRLRLCRWFATACGVVEQPWGVSRIGLIENVIPQNESKLDVESSCFILFHHFVSGGKPMIMPQPCPSVTHWNYVYNIICNLFLDKSICIHMLMLCPGVKDKIEVRISSWEEQLVMVNVLWSLSWWLCFKHKSFMLCKRCWMLLKRIASSISKSLLASNGICASPCAISCFVWSRQCRKSKFLEVFQSLPLNN